MNKWCSFDARWQIFQFMISVLIEFSDFLQHCIQIHKDFSTLNEEMVSFEVRWQIDSVQDQCDN